LQHVSKSGDGRRAELSQVPGLEVDVERLFSGGRDLLGIRRYALKGVTMRMLTLLKAYFERLNAQGNAKWKAQLPEGM
jgi:hypothetical protein